jgi:hypothetical protein
VLTGGDKDFRAGEAIGAVSLRFGPGFDEAQIGTAVGFSEIHGAGPAPFDHGRQIGLLLFGRADRADCCHGAEGQARIHGKGHVGRDQELLEGITQHVGQALAAESLRLGQTEPAAGPELLVSLLETRRGKHRAVLLAPAADLVAYLVERLQNFLHKTGALFQDRLHQVLRQLAGPGQVFLFGDTQNLVQDEQRIVKRGFVGGHGASPVFLGRISGAQSSNSG